MGNVLTSASAFIGDAAAVKKSKKNSQRSYRRRYANKHKVRRYDVIIINVDLLSYARLRQGVPKKNAAERSIHYLLKRGNQSQLFVLWKAPKGGFPSTDHPQKNKVLFCCQSGVLIILVIGIPTYG